MNLICLVHILSLTYIYNTYPDSNHYYNIGNNWNKQYYINAKNLEIIPIGFTIKHSINHSN